jgi:hypothetical protein
MLPSSFLVVISFAVRRLTAIVLDVFLVVDYRYSIDHAKGAGGVWCHAQLTGNYHLNIYIYLLIFIEAV